jgi:hypothetical protein
VLSQIRTVAPSKNGHEAGATLIMVVRQRLESHSALSFYSSSHTNRKNLTKFDQQLIPPYVFRHEFICVFVDQTLIMHCSTVFLNHIVCLLMYIVYHP